LALLGLFVCPSGQERLAPLVSFWAIIFVTFAHSVWGSRLSADLARVPGVTGVPGARGRRRGNCATPTARWESRELTNARKEA